MKDINTNKEQLNKLMNENKIVVVDYFASWCGPCQMYGPVFSEVSTSREEAFAKVDVDKENETAIEASVKSIPTTIIYKEGKEIDRVSGFLSKDNLIEFIEKNKNG